MHESTNSPRSGNLFPLARALLSLGSLPPIGPTPSRQQLAVGITQGPTRGQRALLCRTLNQQLDWLSGGVETDGSLTCQGQRQRQFEEPEV